MVAKWLPLDHQFMCLTDRPIRDVVWKRATLPGWWAKIHLFEFEVPLIYYDLDVVLTGDQTPLAEWDGFGIINDWSEVGYLAPDGVGKVVTPMYNSSVMRLTGCERHVWEQFRPAVMERFKRGGDQRWITARMPGAKTFPPEWFASYKWGGCEDAPPADSLAVIFHGNPKPHEIEGGWVEEYWKGAKKK